MCIGYSAMYSFPVVLATVAFIVGTITYDDIGAHASHWFIRGCSNAFNFGSLEVGATLIAGLDRTRLDGVGKLAVLLSVSIYASTIQTADFRDCEGDRLVGRKTMPLTMPTIARPLVFALMTAWSIALSYLWQLNYELAAVFCSFGLYIGLRFLVRRGVKDDKLSFNWYNLWLTLAHILPGVWRAKHSGFHVA